MKTEVKNRVHTLVDRLFPGFLNEKNTGINPFSESSLVLMQDRFSAQQIRRRQQRTLIMNLPRKSRHRQAQSFTFCFSYSEGQRYPSVECLLCRL